MLSEWKPAEIVRHLDQFIIGQGDAKKAVSIALRNRERRLSLGEHPLREEIHPKNIIMIGPTGVGKTEISRRLAKLAGAPFLKVEATKFTEVGYVGRDVESIVRDLVEVGIALMREMKRKEVRAKAEKACGRRIDEQELASYLMYPKVFTDFAQTVRKYGPVAVLPTPVFFYGMRPGEEITVEIERGKALVVQLTAIGETHEDGRVEVFFELNGQPRLVAVPNRAAAATVQQRRKAEEGNDAHVAAPMPGSVASLAVRQGQKVAAGDVVLTLEAMKMEAALHAPREGVVLEILVHPGSQVDAKDLLMILG